MAKPKVFISHSHADDAFVERLVKDLRAAGADVWFDKEGILEGDFQERIDAALANCQWFVLVLTLNALSSPWVRQEVRAANRLKNKSRIRDLIFIQAGPVEADELPALWGVYNIFDATASYLVACKRVLRAIGIAGDEISEIDPLALDEDSRVLETMAETEQALALEETMRTSGIFMHLVVGDAAKALTSCEELLLLEPHDPKLWDYKAMALRKLGMEAEAEEALKTARLLNATRPFRSNGLFNP